MAEQARYGGRRMAQPQQKPQEDVVPNRPPEPLNLAKPELLPHVPGNEPEA